MSPLALVGDDDPVRRDAIAALVTDEGLRVTAAASAAEVLDALARERPTIVLLVVSPPGLDAFAILEKIRSLPGEYQPVFLLYPYRPAEAEALRGWALHTTAQFLWPRDAENLRLLLERIAHPDAYR